METGIRLDNMRFHAYHGVLEQERRIGNDFEVTIQVSYPFERAMNSDNLNDTLNYAELYAIIEKEMSIPSQLLEHVAGRIITAVKSQFPEVTTGTLTITKLHPPFKCDMPCGGASVIINW